jgi:Synergist-CTERM protein sorting domain-containing protein
VPISVEDDVVVDPGTSTETVTVPSAGIAASIEALQKAIDAGEVSASDSTVEIVVPVPLDTSVAIEEVKVEIAVSDLRTLAASEAAQNVKIVSELGDVKLDTTALNELIAQAQNAENVGVVIAQGAAKVADLLDDSNATQREQLEEKLKDEKTRDIFDVSIYTGDTRLEEFSVTGKLTLGLPYALKGEETPGNVWVDYVDIANNTTERMEKGRGYKESKTLFETDHLSIYAVVYEAADEKPSTESGGGGCDAGFGVFALLAAGIAVMRKR